MTIVTKSMVSDKKDEKAFLNEFEGPPNVAVTIPSDAPPLVGSQHPDDDQSHDEVDNVRIHRKVNGYKVVFLSVLLVAGLTSGFCFFRALHVAQYRRGFCSLPYDLRLFDDTILISGKFNNRQVRPDNRLAEEPEPLPESLITEVKETINENVVREPNGKVGLEYEIDIETDTYEMTQMPELSRGKYLHDFKMNKTLIVDTDNNRCFIMTLNRKEVEPPRDFMEFISRLSNGVYQLDIEEVRHDTRVVLPPLEYIDWRIYGLHITSQCRDKISYLLEDVEKDVERVLIKRNAKEEEFQFIEFGGKKFIKYNIVNLDQI